MRLSLALALLTAAMGLASPAANPDLAAAISEAIDVPAAAMEARDLLAEAEEAQGLLSNLKCRKNGCKCMKRAKGDYCGSCKHNGRYVITENRVPDHLYYCEEGTCCHYGPSRDCDRKKPKCG